MIESKQSRDRLALLPNGKLRHYIRNSEDDDADAFDLEEATKEDGSMMLYDYAQGLYCMDKVIVMNTKRCIFIRKILIKANSNLQAISKKDSQVPSEFAMVCSPEKNSHWTDTEFLLRKIVNPICHGISITILLVVAIIYFVLPSLR